METQTWKTGREREVVLTGGTALLEEHAQTYPCQDGVGIRFFEKEKASGREIELGEYPAELGEAKTVRVERYPIPEDPL